MELLSMITQIIAMRFYFNCWVSWRPFPLFNVLYTYSVFAYSTLLESLQHAYCRQKFSLLNFKIHFWHQYCFKFLHFTLICSETHISHSAETLINLMPWLHSAVVGSTWKAPTWRFIADSQIPAKVNGPWQENLL